MPLFHSTLVFIVILNTIIVSSWSLNGYRQISSPVKQYQSQHFNTKKSCYVSVPLTTVSSPLPGNRITSLFAAGKIFSSSSSTALPAKNSSPILRSFIHLPWKIFEFIKWLVNIVKNAISKMVKSVLEDRDENVIRRKMEAHFRQVDMIPRVKTVNKQSSLDSHPLTPSPPQNMANKKSKSLITTPDIKQYYDRKYVETKLQELSQKFNKSTRRQYSAEDTTQDPLSVIAEGNSSAAGIIPLMPENKLPVTVPSQESSLTAMSPSNNLLNNINPPKVFKSYAISGAQPNSMAMKSSSVIYPKVKVEDSSIAMPRNNILDNIEPPKVNKSYAISGTQANSMAMKSSSVIYPKAKVEDSSIAIANAATASDTPSTTTDSVPLESRPIDRPLTDPDVDASLLSRKATYTVFGRKTISVSMKSSSMIYAPGDFIPSNDVGADTEDIGGFEEVLSSSDDNMDLPMTEECQAYLDELSDSLSVVADESTLSMENSLSEAVTAVDPQHRKSSLKVLFDFLDEEPAATNDDNTSPSPEAVYVSPVEEEAIATASVSVDSKISVEISSDVDNDPLEEVTQEFEKLAAADTLEPVTAVTSADVDTIASDDRTVASDEPLTKFETFIGNEHVFLANTNVDTANITDLIGIWSLQEIR